MPRWGEKGGGVMDIPLPQGPKMTHPAALSHLYPPDSILDRLRGGGHLLLNHVPQLLLLDVQALGSQLLPGAAAGGFRQRDRREYL